MKKNTLWFRKLGWGVFIHFLGRKEMSADEWNECVGAFDAAGLAKQLKEVGAGYLIFTIGQCSGHFCAPNETYDKLTGITPSRCSQRDLIADIYKELNKLGIELLVYIASEGPALDHEAAEALKSPMHWSKIPNFNHPDNDNPHWARYRAPEYYRKWEKVLQEWSLRWGKKVRGWWVDGAYGKNYRFPENEPPNLKTFKDAITSGNPEAIVAFNSGLEKRLIGYTKHNDYTAGEFAWSLPEFTGSTVIEEEKEMQAHSLIYQGNSWGGAEPRFRDDLFVGYTKYVISQGGVLSWDVGTNKNGLITDANYRQLKLLKE